MKKILNTIGVNIVLVSTVLLFNSCGGFLGFDITDQGAIDSNLRPKLEEMLGNDLSIIEISLSEGGGETFSKTITAASVTYFDKEANDVKAKWITLSGKTEMKDTRVYKDYKGDDGKLKISEVDAQKLSEIDFSKIAEIVKAAGAMVEKNENEFSGIKAYTITVNSDPEKVKHTFMIQSRLDSKTTTKSGRLATEISYLEFKFEADAQGNVTMLE